MPSVSSPAARRFRSAEQTITPAGGLTIAHGLGVVPRLVNLWLVCKVADLNYAVGNEVAINPAGNDPSSGGTAVHRGVGVKRDATNIIVKFGSNTSPVAIIDNGTGAGQGIVAASWKLVVEAYA